MPSRAPAARPAEPGMPRDGKGGSWVHTSQEHGLHWLSQLSPLEITGETIPVSSEHFEIYLERIT